MARPTKYVMLFCSNGSVPNALFNDWEEMSQVLYGLEVSPMSVLQWKGYEKELDYKSFLFHTIGGMINRFDWDVVEVFIDEKNDFNVAYKNESGDHAVVFYRAAGSERGKSLPVGRYVKDFLRRKGYKW